jgi:hypothetical protein
MISVGRDDPETPNWMCTLVRGWPDRGAPLEEGRSEWAAMSEF